MRLYRIGLVIICFGASAHGDDFVYTCGNHEPRHSTNNFEEARRFTREFGCRNWSVSSPLSSGKLTDQLERLNMESQAMAALSTAEPCFDPRLEVTTNKDHDNRYQIQIRGVKCAEVKSGRGPEPFAFVYAWHPQARTYILLPITDDAVSTRSEPR